jgi:hypothetical protein
MRSNPTCPKNRGEASVTLELQPNPAAPTRATCSESVSCAAERHRDAAAGAAALPHDRVGIAGDVENSRCRHAPLGARESEPTIGDLIPAGHVDVVPTDDSYGIDFATLTLVRKRSCQPAGSRVRKRNGKTGNVDGAASAGIGIEFIQAPGIGRRGPRRSLRVSAAGRRLRMPGCKKAALTAATARVRQSFTAPLAFGGSADGW